MKAVSTDLSRYNQGGHGWASSDCHMRLSQYDDPAPHQRLSNIGDGVASAITGNEPMRQIVTNLHAPRLIPSTKRFGQACGRSRLVALSSGDLVAVWTADDRRPVPIFGDQGSPPVETIACKFAACDCSLNGTSGFVDMAAIAKPALRCQFGDIGKEDIDTVGNITYIQRPDPGCIDHPSATR